MRNNHSFSFFESVVKMQNRKSSVCICVCVFGRSTWLGLNGGGWESEVVLIRIKNTAQQRIVLCCKVAEIRNNEFFKIGF